MAKKAELLEQAHKLKLDVSNKNTITEFENAIKKAGENTSTTEKREASVAKAGKRSVKGKEEAEEKQEKIEKQHHREDESKDKSAVPKNPVKPARPKSERKGKKYKEIYKLIDREKEYELKEAVALVKKTSATKFDSTVEVHARLNVDPKQADQNIRETITLPSGTGVKIRVAVFGDSEDVKAAKSAGADIAGEDEFLETIDKGKLDFDVLITSPKQMAKLGKYARILGPKGLMPNPKSGTVSNDISKAVEEAKGGKIEFRVDSSGIIHTRAGKVSFSEEDLLSNVTAILGSIKAAKPQSIKGAYIKSIFLTTTMGPSIKIYFTDV